MVKKLVLFDKIYNITSQRKKEEVFASYFKYLYERVKGFSKTSIRIKKLREFDDRFEIEIDGPDEVFVSNILKKEVGTITDFKEVQVGQIYKGTMVDVGKFGFGIFVDCAILKPRADVLIELRTLREQLCKGKKESTRGIVKAYNFLDHYPVYVKIVSIDTENKKLQGEFAQETLKLFKKVIDENIEGIIVCGSSKNQFKKALLKTGHLRDMISIHRFSFLENIVLLKENTDAPGIIAHVGKDLRNCKLSALRAKRIKSLSN